MIEGAIDYATNFGSPVLRSANFLGKGMNLFFKKMCFKNEFKLFQPLLTPV